MIFWIKVIQSVVTYEIQCIHLINLTGYKNFDSLVAVACEKILGEIFV